jgi:hypothetical protein
MGKLVQGNGYFFRGKDSNFCRKLTVEAFRDAILPRLAGLDQRRADALRDVHATSV